MKRPFEIVAAVALIGLVALAVFPTLSAPTDAERVADAAALVRRFEDACRRYRADVGALPREYVGHPAEDRELSAPSSRPGWKGPYIQPMRHEQAVIAARVFLLDESRRPPNKDGFDVDGDGKFETTEAANVLRFDYAEERWAEGLDRSLDTGVPGDWRRAGRVRFYGERAGKPGMLEVLLLP